MAKKRFTDIEIWNKEWYMKLSLKHKCLIRYLFDNCDAAGVWTPNWTLASFQIGEEVSLCDMGDIPISQWELLETGKIFLPDFISFQYGKLSSASPAHKPVFQSIEKNNLSDRLFNRVSNTLQEKALDKDKDKEMDKDKDFGKSENLSEPEMIEGFLTTEMINEWKSVFPKYPVNERTDIRAVSEIAKFICKQDKLPYNPRDGETAKGVMASWKILTEFIFTHKFFRKYSLSQVSNHIQSIIQDFINGDEKAKSGVGGKITGQQLHSALDDFYSQK